MLSRNFAKLGNASRIVTITGTMTMTYPNLRFPVSSYVSQVRNALQNRGWNVISFKIGESYLTSNVEWGLEANVLSNYSQADIRASITRDLSNIIDDTSYILSTPIFTNVFVNSVIEKPANQTTGIFQAQSGLQNVENTISDTLNSDLFLGLSATTLAILAIGAAFIVLRK